MTKTVNSVSVIFATDAGHGWLVLSRNEARAIMGDAFNRITPFSYQHENQVMLEEDQDAALFIQCCKNKGIKIQVTQVNHGAESVIRSLQSFSPGKAATTAESPAASDKPEAPAAAEPETPAPAAVKPEAPAAPPVASGPRTPENTGTFTLPAALLWAAAQFASANDTAISYISIIPEGKTITISATDGRMLLFARIEAINGIHADSVFSLAAKPLTKLVAKAERVTMADGLLCHMDRVGAMITARRPVLGTSILRPYEQLIPDRYGNKPEAPIAFDPDLMQVICKVASKLDARNIRFASNSPINPIGLDFDGTLPCYTDPVTIRCILMPIQIRD